MRPPSSHQLDLSCLDSHDVTSGVRLEAVSDWRNLTTDNSIQIAHLDDLTLTETSFYHGHTNSLKHVDTIVSPPKPGVEEQIDDTYFTKTLVTLDSLVTNSGHLLESRLIFSPSCEKIAPSIHRKRKGREAGSSRYSTIPGANSQNNGKLWHSDSELFLPLAENIQMESKSVDHIPSAPRSDDEASDEDIWFVKPLTTMTNTSKVSKIKAVQKITSSQNYIKAEKAERIRPFNKSPFKDFEIKSQNAVTKVYSKLSRSLKKKRRTITNIGNVTDLLAKVKEAMHVEPKDKQKDTTSGCNRTTQPSGARHCLDFRCEGRLSPELSNSTEEIQAPTKAQKDSRIPTIVPENHEAATVRTGCDQTGSESRRLPALGVRRKDAPQTVTIDDLDMNVVCDLKKRMSLTNTSKRIRIKTNGSLKSKDTQSGVSSTDKARCGPSPKRATSVRRGAAGVRPTRKCIVSTV